MRCSTPANMWRRRQHVLAYNVVRSLIMTLEIQAGEYELQHRSAIIIQRQFHEKQQARTYEEIERDLQLAAEQEAPPEPMQATVNEVHLPVDVDSQPEGAPPPSCPPSPAASCLDQPEATQFPYFVS